MLILTVRLHAQGAQYTTRVTSTKTNVVVIVVAVVVVNSVDWALAPSRARILNEARIQRSVKEPPRTSKRVSTLDSSLDPLRSSKGVSPLIQYYVCLFSSDSIHHHHPEGVVYRSFLVSILAHLQSQKLLPGGGGVESLFPVLTPFSRFFPHHGRVAMFFLSLVK